jgi:hypothetical protein
VAGVNVVTTEFRDAARAQSEALAFEPAIVCVPHPIQNKTTEEIKAVADAALEGILSAIQCPCV